MGKCCATTNPQSQQQQKGAKAQTPLPAPQQQPQKNLDNGEVSTATEKHPVLEQPTQHRLNKKQSPTQEIDQNGAVANGKVSDQELKGFDAIQEQQKSPKVIEQPEEQPKEDAPKVEAPVQQEQHLVVEQVEKSESRQVENSKQSPRGQSPEFQIEQNQDDDQNLDSKIQLLEQKAEDSVVQQRPEVIIDQETAIDDAQKDQHLSSTQVEKKPSQEYQHMKSINATNNQAANKAEMDRTGTEAIWKDTEEAESPAQVNDGNADEERQFIMQLQEPFKTTSELSVVWAKGVEGSRMTAYDGFASFCLEITYQQFLKDKENPDFRFVNFQPNLIIDLHEMIETSEKFQETGNVIERFLPSKRQKSNSMFTKIFDPVTSYKVEVTPEKKSFFKRKEIKEYSPLKRLSEENVTWLANEWIKANEPGTLPTRKQILDGIIDEDRKEVLRMFPRYKEAHAAVEEVLKKRAQAWKTLCAVSGFSIKNMDAKLNLEQISNQPYHPFISTILQIMIMDSPIRNAISRASYEQKKESVVSLGPICMMLKLLINMAQQKRTEDEIDDQCFWIGAQLSKSEIAQIEQMIQTGDQVNLLGNQTCTDHEDAIDQAFKNKPADKEAALIKLTLDPKSGYLPLKKHLSVPDAENVVLLEDGIALQVVACAQSELKKKVKGEVQQYKLIELKSRQ